MNHEDHRVYADWTITMRHDTSMAEDGRILVFGETYRTLDDSEGETHFWCRDCGRDVTEDLKDLEVDYS